jgi:hypothetical protein
MKKKNILFLTTAVFLLLTSCKSNQAEYAWLKNAVDVSSVQLLQTAKEIGNSAKLPRSIYAGYDIKFLSEQMAKDTTLFADSLRPFKKELVGKRRYCSDVYDWTSGFFPWQPLV